MKILLMVFFDPQDLGSRHLAAYLSEHGHDVHILALKTQDTGELQPMPTREEIDTRCRRVAGAKASLGFLKNSEITDHELELMTSFISDYKPDLVGFGTRSKNFVHLPRIIPAIRAGSGNAFLVAGGFGPSLEPEIPLKMGVDAVIRGEGEYAITELADQLQSGQEWRELPSLAYMDDGIIKINPVARIEKNLDNFPFPILPKGLVSIINNDKLLASDNPEPDNKWENGSYFILSSRGCIAECSYCGGRALRDKFREEGLAIPRIRNRKLSKVLEELRMAKEKCGMRRVIFCDEYFVHPIAETISFFEKYKEEINLPFFVHLPAEQIAREPALLKVAMDAGWYNFVFGLQTANKEFCKAVYNRDNNNSVTVKATWMAHDLGMSGYLYMILGNPLEEERHIRESLDLVATLPEFDPSFKTRFFFETNKLGIPYGNPPLTRKFPQLLKLETSRARFFYDAMMLEFRLLLNDTDFNALYNDAIYKTFPEQLAPLYWNTVTGRHREYRDREFRRLKGKDIYIYGGGRAWKENKNNVGECHVKSFIVDVPAPDAVDGIPVIQLKEADLVMDDSVIIMSGMQNINPMYRKLKGQFPKLADITGCVPLEMPVCNQI